MQQHSNLHTLGYWILANFSEQDIFEKDNYLNEIYFINAYMTN